MSVYRTIVALSIKGSRVEKGTEVELSLEEAAIFDPADLVPTGAIPAEPEEEPAEVSLEDMTHAQLKARAKELGLSTAGSVADLRERISLHVPAEPEGEEEKVD